MQKPSGTFWNLHINPNFNLSTDGQTYIRTSRAASSQLKMFLTSLLSGQCGVERMMLFISDNVPHTVSLSSPILSSFKGNVNNNKFNDASFYKFQLMHFKREITKHIEFVDIWSDMYSFYC